MGVDVVFMIDDTIVNPARLDEWMNDLTPVEQRDIAFHDDQITAVRMSDGTVYVPVRPICDLLGVAWQPQARKLN